MFGYTGSLALSGCESDRIATGAGLQKPCEADLVERMAGIEGSAATGSRTSTRRRSGEVTSGAVAVHSGDRQRRVLAAVAVASFVAFVVLAAIVNGAGPLAFDDRMTSFVKGLPIPFEAWLRITDLGGPILIPIGIATVVALLLQHRSRMAVISGLALLGASVWTQFVKVAVERARPAGAVLLGVEGFSFPSGHALNSTVTYGLLALLVSRTRWPTWMRAVLVAMLITLPVLVGLSRVAIGVHYPTDVVGGWLAGIAVVAGVASVTETG